MSTVLREERRNRTNFLFGLFWKLNVFWRIAKCCHDKQTVNRSERQWRHTWWFICQKKNTISLKWPMIYITHKKIFWWHFTTTNCFFGGHEIWQNTVKMCHSAITQQQAGYMMNCSPLELAKGRVLTSRSETCPIYNRQFTKTAAFWKLGAKPGFWLLCFTANSYFQLDWILSK